MRRMMILPALVLGMTMAEDAQAAPKNCPPGLAKKATPCVPPGQAKKAYGDTDGGAPYRRGDIVLGDYVIIRDPGRYGLNPNGTYYRVDDYVLRVDRETREVLDLIGAVAAILD
ncbi:excinuclease ABC subunit A [Roseobacter sp. YSTF-M11]|uniref:Excinuclease ABC subunit A n=1 Tax=Roseobacter insulae TaxID=2859783 RepID=A0A9X1K2I5_9RHOB|nr:excinuclease ABC subunit A [Roseobacter insulae]MBW4708568.1 excinuclease ABC subunit A [Roseobacter insulae]